MLKTSGLREVGNDSPRRLSDEVYTGDKETIGHKQEWIVVRGTHEPFVIRELFETADGTETGGRKGYTGRKGSISCGAGYSVATVERTCTDSVGTGREIIASTVFSMTALQMVYVSQKRHKCSS